MLQILCSLSTRSRTILWWERFVPTTWFVGDYEFLAQSGRWKEFRQLAERRLANRIADTDEPGYNISGNYPEHTRINNKARVGRAADMLFKGKKAEAVRLAHEICDDMPLHADNVAYLIWMLEQAGMKKEADKLFEKSNAAFLAASKVLPGEWTIWKDWADLAARSERGLDKALIHARKAQTLTLTSSGNLKVLRVLAAVHIARKEYDKALALHRTSGGSWHQGSAQMARIRAAMKKTKK